MTGGGNPGNPDDWLVPMAQGPTLIQRYREQLQARWGAVELPDALERKYRNAVREWGWQWLLPQGRR